MERGQRAANPGPKRDSSANSTSDHEGAPQFCVCCQSFNLQGLASHLREFPAGRAPQGQQFVPSGDRGDISASKNAGAHSDPALAGWKEQAELQGGFLITVPSPGIPRSWGCLRDGLLCILSTSG